MSSDPVTYAPIELTWQDTLAAYWAVFWPALLFSAGVALAFIVIFSEIDNPEVIEWAGVGGELLLLGCQTALISRLFRKRFRAFDISVIRDDGTVCRRLPLRDALRVALRVVWPQFAFQAVLVLFGSWASLHGGAESVRRFDRLFFLMRILAVGPWSIRYALAARYQGFRLQARRPSTSRLSVILT